MIKKKTWRASSGRRSGSVVVLSMLAMVSLLGFCALGVDYGVLVATKNRLQRACDAAALAGAAELPASDQSRTDRATYYAQQAASANNVAASEITISYPTTSQIRVASTREVSSLFARALGIMSTQVRANALAGRTPIRGASGMVPLAITVDDYNQYKDGTPFSEELIDNNRQNFIPSTVTAIDLRLDSSGKSGSVFQDDLTNGYSGQTVLGQQVNSSLNADLNSQGAKVARALDDRFLRALGSPWLDTGLNYTYPYYPAGDPRIVTIMVADPNPANNNNPQITARFFAPVYIERYQELGNNKFRIRMRILPARNYSTDDPDVVLGDENTPDTGVGVVRLFS